MPRARIGRPNVGRRTANGPEIASRLGWLAKETGDSRAAGRHFERSRASGAFKPSATWAILALTAAVGISSIVLGEEQLWWDILALTKSGIAAGEYWRLFSVVLVHDGLLHLAFNMYALYIIGPTVEALYGSARFVVLYLACAAAGSTASYLFSDANVSVGASGAVFGLFGVLLVADRVHKPALTRQARGLTTQIGVLIGINLFIGFTTPRIDNAAHIGGLLAGCWLGLVLVPRGAATLSSFWSAGSAADGSAAVRGRSRVSARMGAVLGLVALALVIAAGISIGPLRLGL